MKSFKIYRLSADKNLPVLMGLIVLGTLVGTIAFMSADGNNVLLFDTFSHGFIKTSADSAVFETAWNTFRNTGILLALVFALGFSAISQPLELFILLYRGLALGISLSFFYCEYGLRGLLAAFLFMLPHVVISSFLLVFAVKEAVMMSNVYARFALKSGGVQSPSVREYSFKFVIFTLLLSASSMIDGVLTFFLSNFIEV